MSWVTMFISFKRNFSHCSWRQLISITYFIVKISLDRNDVKYELTNLITYIGNHCKIVINEVGTYSMTDVLILGFIRSSICVKWFRDGFTSIRIIANEYILSMLITRTIILILKWYITLWTILLTKEKSWRNFNIESFRSSAFLNNGK